MIKGSHLTAVQAGGIVSIFGITAVVAKPFIGIVTDVDTHHEPPFNVATANSAAFFAS
jgi:hypothetical protein